jgi:hypothetical protein
VLASVYMLRAFIRTMHNRKGPDVESRDLGFRDALVLVPLVLCVVAFALYPQAALRDGEQAVPAAIAAPREIDSPTPPPAATPEASTLGQSQPEIQPAPGEVQVPTEEEAP